ncbi:MAG: cobalamin B12-binding domain-containing protein [Desulfovibrio sp.]|nr:cobalamin B12-binding domain-containing protein [Desulfovibrio sp.]MBI4959181.1 cobalamin B12-binding domain-containing protein [Desulfovibrio sp.]
MDAVAQATPDERLRVGFVQIGNSFADACYFPYSVGLLQAYVQRHAARPCRYVFLDPLYQRQPWIQAVESMLETDVAAFSVYVWNHNLSLKIARELKRARPGIFIVFGGPHVPDRAEDYLHEHAFIDLACHGEGEQTFLSVLEALPGRDFSAIPSVSWLENGRFRSTPRAPRLEDYSTIPSPYLEGVFDKLMAAHPEHKWLGVWETNRGCPFTCAYCDWGSANASKVHHFEMDRLRREALWFARSKVEFIFCCDGNFGMFKRDRDIAAMVAEIKAEYGYPQALSVQNTKNAAERSFEIQEILSRGGLNKGVTLAMQTMNPTALELVGRQNISTQAFQELQSRFAAAKVETYTDLILALPGETYRSFAEGVSEIVVGGQHNRIQFINLSILPNARMGAPEYQRLHDMVTVESKVINIHGALAMEDDDVAETQVLVVGTGTMPVEDWVRTRAFSWMTALLYFDKLLQIPMLLLQAHHGLACHELVEAFLESDEAAPLLGEIRDFFFEQARAVSRGAPEYFGASECLGIFWPHDEYVFITLSRDGKLPRFYQEAEEALSRVCLKRMEQIPAFLSDAVALNQALVKQPFIVEESELRLEHDVYGAYRAALAGETSLSVSEMDNPATYRIKSADTSWSSWEDWMRKVVWYGNKKGDYLYTADVQR